MKKLFCITMALLLCLGLFGCESTKPDESKETGSAPVETEAPYGETVVLEVGQQVYGEIIDRELPDILVLKLCYQNHIEEWGETVQVVTDEAEKWSIGGEVVVDFTTVERPYDSAKAVRIIAKKVFVPAVTDKPIIYFYPETPTVCSAKLTFHGRLTCTYPAYGKDGWKDFTAYPDGTLIFPDGKEYYALYWEGVQQAKWDFSSGYCVKGEDTAAFLEWALAAQGLTAREANEFIIYWLPIMQENPYNVISFQTKAYTDASALEIYPAPDSLLRVFMAFYASDTEVEIAPQTFDGFERKGFTVVEWGGSIIE